jgi:ribosomal protein L37AE/L43A
MEHNPEIKDTDTNETDTVETVITEKYICPNCNKTQIKIISVNVCDAEGAIWYKCSITKKCPLFQIKQLNI